MRINKITEVYSQSQDKIVSLHQLAQFSYTHIVLKSLFFSTQIIFQQYHLIYFQVKHYSRLDAELAEALICKTYYFRVLYCKRWLLFPFR